jgi:hypothetical protein
MNFSFKYKIKDFFLKLKFILKILKIILFQKCEISQFSNYRVCIDKANNIITSTVKYVNTKSSKLLDSLRFFQSNFTNVSQSQSQSQNDNNTSISTSIYPTSNLLLNNTTNINLNNIQTPTTHMASWHGHSQPISHLQPSSVSTNLPAENGANIGDGVISTRILDNFLIENNILFNNHVTFSSNGQHREQGNDNNNNYEDEETINQVHVATSTAVNRQKNSLGNIR